MKHTNRSKAGFTLIEIILYIGIIAIIFAAIVPFALVTIGSSVKSSVQQTVYSDAYLISERIKYEIRGASGVSNVSANGISLTNFSPDSTTVIDLTGGKARINKNGAGAVNLSSNGTTVSELTFTNNTSSDTKSKNISFVLTVISSGVRQEYQASATLRSSVEVRSN